MKEEEKKIKSKKFRNKEERAARFVAAYEDRTFKKKDIER